MTIRSALRRALRRPANGAPAAASHFWSGVYRDFASVPVSGRGFEDPFWLEESIAYTRAVRDCEGASQPRDGGLLAFAVAALCRERGARVLDLGGGLGVDYYHLARTLPGTIVEQYVVVELDATCRVGRTLLRPGTPLQFVESIDDVPGSFDVVHLSASLQYVADWRALLTRIFHLGAEAVLVSNVFTGSFDTFATGQTNHEGSVIACWFFNRSDLNQLARDRGYRLAVEVASGASYDHSNLPENRRPGQTRNLVYLKASSSSRRNVG